MAFRLRVLFTGLCLHAIHERTGEIAVLMPDARFDPQRHPERGTHMDGTPAVPHVGYLRADLANVAFAADDAAIPYRAQDPCDRLDNGPPCEIVYRLDCDDLDFGLRAGKSPAVTQTVEGLRTADACRIARKKSGESKLRLVEHLFDEPHERSSVNELLLFRTRLRGGYVEPCPREGTPDTLELWSIDGRLNEDDKDKVPMLEKLAGGLMWTRDVTDDEILASDKLTLTLTLRRFDDSRTIVLPLRAVGPEGKESITLKIANLCAENPLEWNEFVLRGVFGEDSDFKWLYTLLEPKECDWPTLLDGQVLPAPRMQSQPPGLPGLKDPPGDCASMLFRTSF